METKNVTPHHLIAALLFVTVFFGAAAARQIFPESWWVKTFLSGDRFILWFIIWLAVLYVAEAWLARSAWYLNSWFTKELGRKR